MFLRTKNINSPPGSPSMVAIVAGSGLLPDFEVVFKSVFPQYVPSVENCLAFLPSAHQTIWPYYPPNTKIPS